MQSVCHALITIRVASMPRRPVAPRDDGLIVQRSHGIRADAAQLVERAEPGETRTREWRVRSTWGARALLAQALHSNERALDCKARRAGRAGTGFALASEDSALASAVVASFLAGLDDLEVRRVASQRIAQVLRCGLASGALPSEAPGEAAVPSTHSV